MRILIAASCRNVVGGIEKYLQFVIPALLRRGHSVGLLYQDPIDPNMEVIEPHSDLPSWCTSELGIQPALDSLRKWAPDIVYYHGLLDSALEIALLNEYPTVLYAHSYDGGCISGRKCYSSPEIRACGRALGPTCVFLYYPRRCGGRNPLTMWRSYQHQLARNGRLSEYQSVLVASRHMQKEFAQYGVDQDQVRLLPLPITDHAPQEAAPSPKRPQGRILYVGRLVDVKGVDRLIRALPEASARLGRHLTVTIAGDGKDRTKLQALAAQHQVNAKFLGWVDAEQKAALFRETDLVAVPSLWPEPFGLVGIEAGAFGVPAVGFDVGGISDWLISGESGELAPSNPPTVAGLADAIIRSLRNPDHYHHLCVGAWNVAKGFSLENHLTRLETILGAGRPAPLAV